MAGRKKIILPLLIVAAAIGLGAWCASRFANHDEDVIRVSGNIETVEVAVSFKIAGRVAERPVDEGERVTAGQVIAKLETADLEADVAQRTAELQAAQSVLDELEAGSRPEEIESARAAMEKAKALVAEFEAGSRRQEIDAARAQLLATEIEQNRMERDYVRAQKLLQQNTISQEQYDQARAAYRMAVERYQQALQQYDMVKEGPRKEQIDQAKAARDQMIAQYELVKKGPRQEQIDQAKAKVGQAKAALLLAKTRLGYATITSPLTGVVLSKNTEPGEYVAPGTPVVTVADIENVWLRAYVDGKQVGERSVRWGQEAEVSTDAYPKTVYHGVVSFISEEAEFTPKSIQTEKERVRLVYRIKIDIKNTQRELKPGMPADARILPASGEGK